MEQKTVQKPEATKPDDTKYILSPESAANEIKKLFDYYEIELDEIEDADLKKAIKMGYDRLIKAVRMGRLEIKVENGIHVIQHLRSGKTDISYREIDGKSKTSMAGKSKEDYYGKSYALMGSLSNLGEAAITQLKGVDLSLAEVLGLIFLAV